MFKKGDMVYIGNGDNLGIITRIGEEHPHLDEIEVWWLDEPLNPILRFDGWERKEDLVPVHEEG